MVLLACITIIGLITGWYFFLFIALPFGILLKKDNQE